MAHDLRLVFIGDSFVAGVGDPEFRGWTGRICARAARPDLAITHYSLGIRRNTSRDVAARWQAEAEARLVATGDAAAGDGRLVFSFGVNDTVLEQGVPRVGHDESLATFTALIAQATAWRPTLVVGPPPVRLDDPDGSCPRIAALSAAYARRSGKLGVPYLDVFTPLRASGLWSEQVTAGDGAHPSAAGYDLLAELVSGWSAWREWVGQPT